MGCLQPYITSILFFLSGLIQWGGARVLVEVQSGPLHRVIGYPISISCNVSGFSNPSAQQDFRFSVYKPKKNTQEIQIISTDDKNYAMAVYGDRVRRGGITLERLSVTSVLFHVKSLEDGDEGEYECHTPNSEAVYDGTYNAKTTLKVIGDTLTASSTGPASFSLSEGDDLTLQCLASSNTFQHTHLSITWYHHGDREASPHPIISLDRDLKVSPGQRFEGRYQAGFIVLDKLEEATYRLKMARIELSDAGRISCQAQEWIQDPDRSWYPIAQKDTQPTTLEVKAIVVAPDQGSSSMVVSMTVHKTHLQEGEELSLQCIVNTQGPVGQFFSVAWVKDNQELAHIGPTGVLSVGPEYGGRETGGELRAARTKEKTHLLTLRPVRTQDQGVYHCRAWPEERDGNGVFTQGSPQDSTTETITITATESGLAVAMDTQQVSVDEGDALQLTCRVSGVKGQLSITWQHRSASMATGPFSDVISLSRVGVMELGAEFGKRNVRTMRPMADIFTLELGEVTPSDAGAYQCTVSEWTTEANGNGKKTHSQSQDCSVEVHHVESLLSVYLSSRGVQVTVGGEVELVCRVQGPSLPVTVTWSLQREGQSAPDNILTLSYTGDITWSGDQSNYQLRATTGKKEVRYYLRIIKASHKEAGRYQCVISVFLQGRHRKPQNSNALGVLVQTPKGVLTLSSSSSPLDKSVKTDIQMECSVAKATSNSSRFAVSWLAQKNGEGNKTVLSSDRDAVITLGLGLGTEQRISMRRREGRSFELTIRQARSWDNGMYYCVVEEWLQDPHGQWYKLPPSSAAMELRLKETVSDLSVDKTKQETEVREGEGVELTCTLTSGASDPASLYALTWFYLKRGSSSSSRVPLVILGRDGLLKYPGYKWLQDQKGRLIFSRPTHGTFLLGLQRALQGDSGVYQCQVDQYKLNQEGIWEQTASDQSGTADLTVKPIESVLTLSSSPSPLDQSVNTDIQMECSVVKPTANSSFFAVIWLAQKKGEGNQTILHSYHDAVVTVGQGAGLGGEQRISMRRHEGQRFELTIRQARSWDSGMYYCVVEEWLQDPLGRWYKLLPSSAAMELRVLQTVTDLSVNQIDLEMEVKEGEGAELTCALTSGDPASLYALTWFYMRRGSSSSLRVPLVILGHDGVLKYPEDQDNQGLQDQKGRLIFSRPTHGTFLLGLQRALQGDSGVYQCQVDQYKIIHGNWELSATNQSGTTNLTVRRPIEDVSELLSERGFVTESVLVIFIPLVCILSILVVVLSIKLKQQGSAGNKKQAKSLWLEFDPLNPRPED
ncbi:immunoglobulin superfamily member 3 isoform X1 [Oncorhynchus tshawytscha]|uniref:immunoglobulin superfamily member 3 isoform X1 n=1 Tax=Oncorhynchus tshawytscha TaxID=74940 RepID=UPI000D0A3F34|nr:immunoglobulin superfamily member 3 isoform X1 [Oncorhynchus tshawytscha]